MMESAVISEIVLPWGFNRPANADKTRHHTEERGGRKVKEHGCASLRSYNRLSVDQHSSSCLGLNSKSHFKAQCSPQELGKKKTCAPRGLPNVPGRETIGSVRAAGIQTENVLDGKQDCLFSFVGHKRRHQRGYL